jgi:hypothetical protein
MCVFDYVMIKIDFVKLILTNRELNVYSFFYFLKGSVNLFIFRHIHVKVCWIIINLRLKINFGGKI